MSLVETIIAHCDELNARELRRVLRHAASRLAELEREWAGQTEQPKTP
jgi:hypothetical protein